MYVEQWRDRHGKVRLYFRRGKGPRIPLPGPIGSDGFAVAYGEAIAGRAPKTAPTVDRDTLGWLIDKYERSSAYVELRASTRRAYDIRFAIIRREHGHRSLSSMTAEGITMHVLEPYAGQPGARLDTLKKLRILINYAIRIGEMKHDPSRGIKRPKTEAIRSWTEAEIAAYESRWPPGTKQRLAFHLHLYTGQRGSDVHRMTWADVEAGRIHVVQQKTGKKLSIPLHSALAAELAITAREHMTIVNTAYGQSFTVKGFGQWMRDAITAAGLPIEARPHGLRKAAGRRLAEAGCSAKEIMAVLGHDTLAEAERYIEEADQGLLSSAAVTKLEARKANGTAKPFPKPAL